MLIFIAHVIVNIILIVVLVTFIQLSMQYGLTAGIQFMAILSIVFIPIILISKFNQFESC